MAATDLATLNRRFGAPGRIAFREGPAGAPVVVLAENRGGCEVALYGGHVLSYRPTGHAPVLWLARSAATVAPGKPIRGGIPVCWPWFGPHPDDPARPMHGFARTRPWRLRETEYDAQRTSARLVLGDDEETRALWPHPFELELFVAVDDALRVSLTTTNRDRRPVTVSQALHSYFLVRQIMDVTLNGLDGAAYLDRSPAARDGRQEGPVVIRAETDRVYVDTEAACELIDPGIGRRLVIAKEGSRSTVVWNPWIEKTKRLTDLEAEDYLRFLCVETTNAEADAVRLEPGESHTLSVTVRAVLR